MKYLMRALSTATFILQWFTTAMADGKITPMEMAEFVTKIAEIWKIRVVVDTSMLIDENVASELVDLGGELQPALDELTDL